MSTLIPKGERNLSTRRRACPSTTFSTTNPVWTDPQSAKLATDLLNHGTALSFRSFLNHYILPSDPVLQEHTASIFCLEDGDIKLFLSSDTHLSDHVSQTSEHFSPITTSILYFVRA
jgi:hypothetical protein